MLLGRDVGVDLGTAAVRLYVRGKGVALREPSVLAVDKRSGQVLAVGAEAQRMLGRTPVNLKAVRPVDRGVIADLDMTVQLLREYLHRVTPLSLVKPRMLMTVPSSITKVEEQAAVQAGLQAGARHVFLLEAPLAAAMGAGLPIGEASGRMVVHIGAGSADIAVLSLGGICVSQSCGAGGNAMREALRRYLRREHGMTVGAEQAEELKLRIGCVAEARTGQTAQVRGRDLLTGLPRLLELEEQALPQALSTPSEALLDAIREVLEQTPPELVADITHNGITLTGGGSRLRGLARRIQDYTHIPTVAADNGEDCVIAGMEQAMQKLDARHADRKPRLGGR